MKTIKLVMTCGLATAAAFASFGKTKVVEECRFCSGNVSYIEDDPVPVTPSKKSDDCNFCNGGSSSGSSYTYWTAATERSLTLSDGGTYAGTVVIKTTKISSKNKVGVSITFKMKSGKKYTAKKVSVTPDGDWTLYAVWSNVKGLGKVTVSIGIDGAVDGVAGDYEFSTEGVDPDDPDDPEEVFEHGEHTFFVESADYTLNEKYDLLFETIPDGVEIVTSTAKKWNCGTAPKIKYQKFKEDGETWYELVGLDDEVKTNYSNLKLTFDKKKNTVKGSFKALATNEMSIEKGKPKLKSYTFTLKGSINGSTITGTATCKSLKAYWNFTID